MWAGKILQPTSCLYINFKKSDTETIAPSISPTYSTTGNYKVKKLKRRNPFLKRPALANVSLTREDLASVSYPSARLRFPSQRELASPESFLFNAKH